MLVKNTLLSLLASQRTAIQCRHNHSIRVGSKASLSKVFTQADVEQFAKLSLDDNAIHLDADAARKAGFEKQIVHGLLVNGLASAILGTILPGKGSIFVNETINFVKPVHVDRKVTVEVEVTKMVEKMKKTFYELEFRGYVENPTNSDLCIKGTAQVLKREVD